MAWDSCRHEVESSGDKMCDVKMCADSQAGIDRKCHTRQWPAGHPFGIYLPDGSLCFCCCSCFAYDTPIQVSTGTFKAIQDFIPGDAVLATGPELDWKKCTVDLSSGIEPTSIELFMVYVQYADPNGEMLDLVVTEDHLFLMNDRTLVPASALKSGDKLMRPDGSISTVNQAYLGKYIGGVHHISTGKFTGSLDGHLLNSNDVVTADMSVKLEYQTGSLDSKLLTRDLKKRLKVGSESYTKLYYDKEAIEFMANPIAWPRGFTIATRQNLILVPETAFSYITDDQARKIMDSGAPRRDFDSNAAIMKIQYVYSQFKAFHSDTIYLMDWNNPVPNGYAFNYYNQNIILLTGGLLRLYCLNSDGFALIICHLLARLYGVEFSGKSIKCVGPADYEAVASYFTTIYQAQQFPNQFPKAMEQIEKFFELITENEVEDNVIDRCNNPTITCRIKTYYAAAAIQQLPECANPETEHFRILDAKPSNVNDLLTVEFSGAVNPPTAETKTNYKLMPEASITEAKVDEENFAKVNLSVQMEELTEYELTITNVLSEYDEETDPNPAKFVFKTGKCKK